MNKNMQFAIFLDVDGVLNARGTVQHTPNGYIGIDDARVEILAKAVNKFGDGKIILTSDWKTLKNDDDDYVYLVSKLGKFGLNLSGKTTDHFNHRGEGIINYLDEHPEIEEFVVLDDNIFDYQDYQIIWERLIRTNGIERAEFASETPAIEAILFMDYIIEVL